MGLLNVTSQQFKVIHTPVPAPVALTFDVSRGSYYWADIRGSIYKSDGRQSWSTFNGELVQDVVALFFFLSLEVLWQ